MAAKRDEGKEGEQQQGRGAQQQQQQQQQAITRSIDETQENIKQAIEEARREIPRYTRVANDYQSQTIDAAEEIVASYLDSQKQVVNAMQSSWNQNMQQPWWGVSPQTMADMYSRLAGSVAQATIASARMTSNMMFASMDAARTSMNYARDNAKEMNRVATNFAATFEDGNVSRQRQQGQGTGGAGESERQQQQRRG